MWCCLCVRDPYGVVYDSHIFWKSCFVLKNAENRPNPGFFECIEKFRVFFSVLYFFISLVYNESLYYCNSCMLEQISYLRKFWFLRFGPKCSWPIRLQDFSIDHRTLKLTVSHKEINDTNWFLVYPSISFLRNGSLGFSGFWHNGRLIRILKAWQSPFFQENSFLAQIWAKGPRMGPK